MSIRSLEHCYLIDDEAIAMAEQVGAFLVPTMQMTREDKELLKAGKLPEQAGLEVRRVAASRKRKSVSHKARRRWHSEQIAACSHTFSEGVLRVPGDGRLASLQRALKAGTSLAAELLQRDDLGALAPGKQADMVAMPGDLSRIFPAAKR